MLPNDHWLNVNLRTIFKLSDSNRIIQENDPDSSPGPRFYLANSEDGDICAIGDSVSNDVAKQLEGAAEEEPLSTDPTTPTDIQQFVDVLKRSDSNESPQHNLSLIYDIPHSLNFNVDDVKLIDHDSEAGQELQSSWDKDGVPGNLGFKSAEHVWEPWCAVVVDEKVACLAFAARLSDEGAELGLVTPKEFRGHGYAAAATAGWSKLKELEGRKLFYSTSPTNDSSQRVTIRLGLTLIGSSLKIY